MTNYLHRHFILEATTGGDDQWPEITTRHKYDVCDDQSVLARMHEAARRFADQHTTLLDKLNLAGVADCDLPLIMVEATYFEMPEDDNLVSLSISANATETLTDSGRAGDVAKAIEQARHKLTKTLQRLEVA